MPAKGVKQELSPLGKKMNNLFSVCLFFSPQEATWENMIVLVRKAFTSSK